MDIQELRKQMNEVDCQLVQNFQRRMQIALEIAKYKKQTGMAVYDPAREQEVLNRQTALVCDELKPYVAPLYRMLFEVSRSYQHCYLGDTDNSKADDNAAEHVPNLVLIGMPGCGKSTMGRLIAQRLHKPLVDLDDEIAKAAGMSLPEIFEREGEDGFRERETEALLRFTIRGGQVIATGGGSVKRDENRRHLRKNGYVIHLLRDIEALSLEGRPLSKNREALEKLWQERKALYADCADETVDNNSTIETCVDAIEKAWIAALSTKHTYKQQF